MTMNIAKVMTRDVKVASPDDTLQQAAEMMCDIDAGVLPVGENDRLVGMLTDRDITTRAVARGLSPSECTVRDVMSPEIKYIYEDDTVEDAARNMGALQIRRLPVLNRAKRLVGIVSLGDLALEQKKAAGEALSGVSRH
jgi:CBS domain-containing protein